jgi:sugar/nucleoside kinase (ribokinase family)
MLKKLKVAEYQVIVITDGKRGAYAYDGEKLYHCPVFPSDVVSTLGAGDAFASTFFSSLQRTQLNIGKSLMYASVQSSSVVSKFGATEGLITFEDIEERLAKNPDYTYTEV